MRQLLRFKSTYIFTLLASAALLSSCDKDMNVSLGNSPEEMGVSLLDTISVNASTFQLDYIPSAATGSVLVGQANQAQFGEVKSTSFLRLQYENLSAAIPDGATFDSVSVVLRPHASRYYFGDTTQNFAINIHRVTEEIKTQNILNDIDNYKTPIYVTSATIFNNQSFAYESSPLGTKTIKPRVQSLDTVSIRLDQSFGQSLYNMIKANDYNVSSDELLQKHLKGLVIAPENSNKAVIAFNDTVTLKLNYSYTGSDGFKISQSKNLTTSSRAFQFNKIEYNRAGTPFQALSSTNRELKSNESNQKILIQSGTGAVAKLSIPSLKEFMTNSDIAINKAELVVELENPKTYYSIPNGVMLMVANSNNIPISYIRTPFSTTVQQVNYIAGNDVGVNNRYVFNLIEYVKNINSDLYRDASLLISASSPALNNTLNTAIVATENGKPNIKLNIVYTKFK